MQMRILLSCKKIELKKIMPKASVKRLIECEKNQLIDLVLDIEKYPEFVPFCIDAHVHEKKEKDDLLGLTNVAVTILELKILLN